MPTYLFYDKTTDQQYEMFLSISERDKYLADNPHVEQLVNGFPGTVDPTRLGLRKPDNGFRDRLKEIKKSHRKSSINTW